MARIVCVKPCTQLPINGITIPFIGTMKPILPPGLKVSCDGCDLAQSIFSSLQPFTLSLGIPLCLLGCATAIVEFAQAIPDSLGPPPDPTALATALLKVLNKCRCALEVALPPPAGAICQFLKFVRDILVAIQGLITCLLSIFSHITILNARGALLKLTPGNPDNTTLGECLIVEAQSAQDASIAKFASMTVFISTLQPMFDLIHSVIPLPELEDIKVAFQNFEAAISGSPTTGDVVSSLQDLSDALALVVTAIQLAAAVCP